MSALVLASTSSYRKLLLEKLAIPFETCSVDTDETPLESETAQQMVMRLASAKAKAGAEGKQTGIIIGSDQAAVLNGKIIGKPLTSENAVKQLMSFSGRKINFYTGLALYNVAADSIDVRYETFTVHFRDLTEAQIRYYVDKEQPLYCAGSFMCEGLGIALFTQLEGRDPNCLVGLPLILLTEMLLAQGVDVLNP
ncbi:Maf family protein [Shewanella sp. Isolate11]|uniref:Maf family protein n=1 Tax=Shewanella sp. Isolate11 TaxID=2908530 RepID=UPI001EFE6948|nr:Maf family protein [Shewanella sp. Isolate11]MCG9696979.1 Maf-like protein [Shewanella sp. Isolate11]